MACSQLITYMCITTSRLCGTVQSMRDRNINDLSVTTFNGIID